MIFSSQKHSAVFLVSVLSLISTVSRAHHPGHTKFLDTLWSAVAQFVFLPPLKGQAKSLLMSACSLHQSVYQLQKLLQLPCSTKKTYVTKGEPRVFGVMHPRTSIVTFGSLGLESFLIILMIPFCFSTYDHLSLSLDQSASFSWLSREFHQSASCSGLPFL